MRCNTCVHNVRLNSIISIMLTHYYVGSLIQGLVVDANNIKVMV